jgi:hypothetical protein
MIHNHNIRLMKLDACDCLLDIGRSTHKLNIDFLMQ